MANSFGTDILIQTQDPEKAASFYVTRLGFEITDSNPKMIGLNGKNINLFIEPGLALGPELARNRRVIAFERQRYGYIADIADRPFGF